MIPILKGSNEKVIGWLKDVKTCHARRRLNGMEEITLTYPVSGKYFNDLVNTHSIEAKSNPFMRPQIFDIYEVSKAINGIVTIKAEHMSYRLSHYPVDSVSLDKVDAAAAMRALIENGESKLQNPTHFEVLQTDIPLLAPFNISNVSAKAGFGGVEGSVLDTYGGEFEYDNEKITLHKHRGFNRGVKFAYGKNITDFELTVSSTSSYTSIYGFYKKDEVSLSTVEFVENKSGIKERALLRDFSNDFENDAEVTQERLDQAVKDYLKKNDINSLTVSGKIKVFANRKQAQKIDLGDIVTVSYTDMNIDILAKVIYTDYDVIAERYDEIEIGSPGADLASTIKQANREQQAIKKEVSTTVSRLTIEHLEAIKKATEEITGQKESYIVLNPPTKPAEFLCLDKPDINTARNVWRFNRAGLGHSSTGYNGIYTLAILADGSINADMIRVGILNANLIRAGIAQSANGEFSFNFEDGVIRAAKAYLTGEFTVVGDRHSLKLVNYVKYVTADDKDASYLGLVKIRGGKERRSFIGFTDREYHGVEDPAFQYDVNIRSEENMRFDEYEGSVEFDIHKLDRPFGIYHGSTSQPSFWCDGVEATEIPKGIRTGFYGQDIFAAVSHQRSVNKVGSWTAILGAGRVEKNITSVALEHKGNSGDFLHFDFYSTKDGENATIKAITGSNSLPPLIMRRDGLYYGDKKVVLQ